MDAVLPKNQFPQILTSSGQLHPRKRVTSVTLAEYDDWHFFYCPDCRQEVFRYKGQVVKQVESEAPFIIPIEIQCRSRNNCNRIIRIEGFIERAT